MRPYSAIIAGDTSRAAGHGGDGGGDIGSSTLEMHMPSRHGRNTERAVRGGTRRQDLLLNVVDSHVGSGSVELPGCKGFSECRGGDRSGSVSKSCLKRSEESRCC